MATRMANEWKPFKVNYTRRGRNITEEAYLTISLDDDTPCCQLVVLPESHIYLARWVSEGPVDLAVLRAKAIANVPKLDGKSRLSDIDIDC